MFTLKQIEDAITDIICNNTNNSYAHKAEDILYTETLRAIADGAPNAKELAAAALKAEDIEFERWYE